MNDLDRAIVAAAEERDRTAAMTPGTAELDALLEAIEADVEGGRLLFIPITPPLIRWLLRGTFEDGLNRARMTGGTLRGNEFTPVFTLLGIPTVVIEQAPTPDDAADDAAAATATSWR